jgi:hypothetical protein
LIQVVYGTCFNFEIDRSTIPCDIHCVMDPSALHNLPEHIKSRIISHVFQPKPPVANSGDVHKGTGFGETAYCPKLQGRSITQGPLVLDDYVRASAAQV